AAPVSASILALGGCRSPQSEKSAAQTPYRRRVTEQTGPTHDLRLVAQVSEVQVAPRHAYRTWVYDGKFPGAEIRVKEGDRLRIVVDNELPEGTTVHWHGVRVPNPMDGVPGLTQQPIKPGENFVYDYVAAPTGTYIYHAHAGLQLDRGLMGPLIIEEKQPHISYDRDYVIVLDDFLPDAPKPLAAGGGMMGSGGSGMMGRMMGGMRQGQSGMMDGGMMGVQMPPYAGLMINGHLPEDPVVFDARKGERLRIRFLNPSGASAYRVAVGGHRMAITHTDSRPVKPFPVDAFDIGMGERYDVLVETNNPGVWWIVAAPLQQNLPPARAILRYLDSAQAKPALQSLPEGLHAGHLLDISELESLEPLLGAKPDQTFDFLLSGGMMSSAWAMNGQAYPNADPVEIHEGSQVRVRMTNHTMMLHPMHLHGHFFRVANVLKDTVIVPPMMGSRTFQFLADNPGRWLFHCHNIYHMESGMAREVRYV
ncbi:MAG TPA: multicopper oxidase family protein, partial [Candidatus Sulfotelmatobacter sp.]|nr:multicopper oxidase family protein [Candidatus Sulfotelmatobacter sp.]